MLKHLKYFANSLASSTKYAKINLFSKMPMICYSNSSQSSSNSDIIDVNIDKMMSEDDELSSNYNYDTHTQAITTRTLDDGVMAPLDVNPWIDEEFEKGGTIDMEYIEKEREEIHYPETPKERSGYYEFEGIKIWLPKRMLTPATYRYRLTEEEQQTLPDDIRICKFEKFKPTS